MINRHCSCSYQQYRERNCAREPELPFSSSTIRGSVNFSASSLPATQSINRVRFRFAGDLSESALGAMFPQLRNTRDRTCPEYFLPRETIWNQSGSAKGSRHRVTVFRLLEIRNEAALDGDESRHAVTLTTNCFDWTRRNLCWYPRRLPLDIGATLLAAGSI